LTERPVASVAARSPLAKSPGIPQNMGAGMVRSRPPLQRSPTF
jgi:hypothetical protein